jgi:hypothetical protein
LKPHASVLRNLGQAELKTGHYLEAARHLSTFIRDTNFGTPPEREAAKKALTEAESKLGKLVVEVDVDGAEITVDGAPTGRSPMGPDPVYVDPGQRVVRVQKDGCQPYEQPQTLEAGRTTQLKVALHASEPVPTEAASVSRIQSNTLIVADAGSTDQTPSRSPVGPSPFRVDADSSGGGGVEPRTVVLIAGAGLTVVAFGLGGFFTLKGASADSDANDQRAEVDRQLGANGCANPVNATQSACITLTDTLDRRNHADVLARGAFITGGVLGAATVATFFLWPRRPGSLLTSLIITPRSGEGATLWATGRFE